MEKPGKKERRKEETKWRKGGEQKGLENTGERREELRERKSRDSVPRAHPLPSWEFGDATGIPMFVQREPLGCPPCPAPCFQPGRQDPSPGVPGCSSSPGSGDTLAAGR